MGAEKDMLTQRTGSENMQYDMKIGDKVKPIAVPIGLQGDETRSLFEGCLGRVFPIIGVVPVPEIDSDLLELHVGELVGKPAYMHSIWIEKELVEIVEPS